MALSPNKGYTETVRKTKKNISKKVFIQRPKGKFYSLSRNQSVSCPWPYP